MIWISPKDKLPEEKRWVLVLLNKNNWIWPEDQDGVYYKVASLVKGISEDYRRCLPGISERKRIYKFGDVHGNNLVPYEWQSFGPGGYFGQEVICWAEIPRVESHL